MSLAVKYRPRKFEEVCEQESIIRILTSQLKNNGVRNAYLFAGSAGCGKTTCARIFASELNKGLGNPLELDGASNNSVDDVRQIISQAKLKSLDSEYKVFIIDECHALSNSAWQAMLKLIEEPPAKTVFIFCTTDPQKIPKTILSRVQRYDFQRISISKIEDRLEYILRAENVSCFDAEAIEYVAKIADGGMRDAITYMDKCLAYSSEFTIENVIKALGVTHYSVMLLLTKTFLAKGSADKVIEIVEDLYDKGTDIKQFVKSYVQFLIDVKKWEIGCDWSYLAFPQTSEITKWLCHLTVDDLSAIKDLLVKMIKLNADIKYSLTPKYDLEAVLLV